MLRAALLLAVVGLVAAQAEVSWTQPYARAIEAMFHANTGLSVPLSTSSVHACLSASASEMGSPMPQSHDFILNMTSFCVDSPKIKPGCNVAECASVVTVDHFDILGPSASTNELVDILHGGQPLVALARLSSSETEECDAELVPVLVLDYSHADGQAGVWKVQFPSQAIRAISTKHARRCGLFDSMLKPVYAIPAAWDWRLHGAVTPVYNQGQMGDVLAIVATEALEGLHAIKTNVLVDLNYNEVDACCGSQELSWGIFKCMQEIGGVCMASSTPSTSCNNHTCKAVATLTGFNVVESGNISALQEAVLANPVAAAIDAGIPGFQIYTSGVFNPASCSPTQLDHAVLVVGWGVSGSEPYWILKNSWGTAWGEEGYMLLIREAQDKCGIAVSAAYPTCNTASC